MKAYVIKNKKGEYWSGHKWETNLIFAYIFPEKTAFLNDDEVWQEITIVEGNLEVNQNQKAIECLKKVREKLYKSAIQVVGTGVNAVRLYSINEIFDNKIKELEGEE